MYVCACTHKCSWGQRGTLRSHFSSSTFFHQIPRVMLDVHGNTKRAHRSSEDSEELQFVQRALTSWISPLIPLLVRPAAVETLSQQSPLSHFIRQASPYLHEVLFLTNQHIITKHNTSLVFSSSPLPAKVVPLALVPLQHPAPDIGYTFSIRTVSINE